MIKALIIEDEAIAARRLEKLLTPHGITVLSHIKSNQALAAYLKDNPEPDIYFMDIHLNDGIVFEYLKSNKLSSPIIFTTAYDEYAIKAFKQNSIDYLMKPIDLEELENAIQKFKLQSKTTPLIDHQLLSQILMRQDQSKQSYRERIKIKIGDHFKTIKISEIAIIFSRDKINYVLTSSGRQYPIDYALDKIFVELDPSVFFKVNRANIISIEYLQDIISYSNSRLKVIMQNAKVHEIIVARERVQAFKSWLG